MHLRSRNVTSSIKTRTNEDNFHSSNSQPFHKFECNAQSNKFPNKDKETDGNAKLRNNRTNKEIFTYTNP